MKLTRVWLVVAALVLSITMATTGTIAYLTDTDGDVNVMTLGNVEIEQIEKQRAEGVAHTGEGKLVDFEQNQGLYPAVPVPGATNPYTAEQELFLYGSNVTAEGAGNGLWNDNNLKGAMDKFVFVKNTGSSDAYYRTIIAFECPEGMDYSAGPDKEFMMNVNGNHRFDWSEVGYVEIDGVRYLVMVAQYNEKLAPGEISRPSLLQVVMTHNATNEDMALLGNSYEIRALSQAVQTANFEDVDGMTAGYALDLAFGAATVENVAEWLGGMKAESSVDSGDELNAALNNGNNVIDLTADVEDNNFTIPAGSETIINGNDHAIEADYIENIGDVTYNDVVMNSGTASDYANINYGDVEYNNVNVTSNGGGVAVVDGAKATFNGGSVAVDATTTNPRYNFYVVGEGSELTINGGEFSIAKLSLKRAYIYAGTGTTVYVNGGNFGSASTRSGYTAGILGDGTVIITGGTFGFDPSAWVPATHQAVKDGTTWTVSAK